MIKVIQVLTDTNIGGAGIWLLNFLKTYDRSFIDMSVVLPENSKLKERIEELGVRIIESDSIADCSASLGGIKALDLIFKTERPDIVHTHASLSARIAAKKNKIPVIHTRHCLEDRKKNIKRAVYRFINNILSDKVIAVSDAVCRNLLEDGIEKDKLCTVYNGIFPLREISQSEKELLELKYKIPTDKVIVGMVARLEPVKNHKMLLEAAKAIKTICPEAYFVIVGDGTLDKELKQLASKEGILDSVTFTGYIKDVNDIMNVIDIHVLTSEKEALSISLIEAMSLAKPVVATRAGGPEEVVENGVSGILVNVDDAVNLTMAIVRLIQHPDLREKLGQEGKRIVNQKFLAENMARNIEDIYKGIIEQKGSRK